MFADYHIHTNFSHDSVYVMEEIVKKAIQDGIEELCFTDHVDYGVVAYHDAFYDKYYKEFLRCKHLYKDQIVLKFGAEFGMQTHTIPLFEKDFEKNAFDFVILSCHQVDNKEFWNQEFQKGKTQEEYNLAYYQEILNVMKQYQGYSVLGHLDAIKRDDKAGIYPFEKTKNILTEI